MRFNMLGSLGNFQMREFYDIEIGRWADSFIPNSMLFHEHVIDEIE
jgi:hypothetical protein